MLEYEWQARSHDTGWVEGTVLLKEGTLSEIPLGSTPEPGSLSLCHNGLEFCFDEYEVGERSLTLKEPVYGKRSRRPEILTYRYKQAET